MKKLFLLPIALLCMQGVSAQTNFGEINLLNGADIRFKAHPERVADAGDIIFQKLNGEEMARIRSVFHENTGLTSILLSSGAAINDLFWFSGLGNLGIGFSEPQT